MGKHKRAKRPFYGRSDTCGGGFRDSRGMEGSHRPPSGVLELRSRNPDVLHDHGPRTMARYSWTDLATCRRYDAEPAPAVLRAAASPTSSGAPPTALTVVAGATTTPCRTDGCGPTPRETANDARMSTPHRPTGTGVTVGKAFISSIHENRTGLADKRCLVVADKRCLVIVWLNRFHIKRLWRPRWFPLSDWGSAK
jgi:hypothetical protein